MPDSFGRAGLATASGGDGLSLRFVTWEQRGDQATVEGVIKGSEMTSATALADVKALRDQLQGYDLNTDEPVIPVISAHDSSRDGFYRVQRIEVSSEVTGRLRSGSDGNELAYTWTAELLRVPGWQAPLFEVLCSGASRANGHAVTETNGWVAVPGSATSIETTYTFAPVTSSLVGGGTVSYDEATNLYTDPVLFSVPTANHYEGAAKITQNGRTVVGRQVVNDPDGWVISNGLVKIRPSLTEINHLVVGVRNTGATDYDEIAYRVGYFDSPDAFEWGYDGSNRVGATSVAVLRNSPECVTARVVYGWQESNQLDGGGSVDFGWPVPVAMDFTVRRGQTYVEIRVSIVGTQRQLGIWRATTDNGSSITGGIENNADDAAGNKYRIYTTLAKTADTTNGGAYLNASTTAQTFAVGNDIVIFTGTTVADQFYAAQNHRQTIVAR